MAQVPIYRPQVGPSGLPGVRQGSQAPAVIPVGEFNARQTQQLGATVMDSGQKLAKIQIQLQEEANQLRVDDALNKAKEVALKYTYDQNLGFMNQRGEAALSRQSGKPLSDEYAETLDKEMQAIGDGLGNDRQREVFNAYRNRMLGQFRESVMQHEYTQFKEYGISTYSGKVALETRSVALNYNNPQMVQEGIDSINRSMFRLGKLQGWSADQITAKQIEATSVAHRTALAAALDHGDVAYASSYLKEYRSQMEAGDILRVQNVLTEVSNGQRANRATAAAVTTVMPAFEPSDIDRAFNILKGTESNNRQFDDDGKPLTSSAGAIGIAQVMPKTGPEAARLAGLPWDEERYKNDAEYNEALGRAYFEHRYKEFGDLAQTYAAYNAGAGWVRKAIDRAKKAEPGTQEADWFWQLNNDERSASNREQTRNYVEKNIREFNAGLGAPKKPTLSETIDIALGELGGDASPALRKATIDLVKERYEAIEKSAKTKNEQAVAKAMRLLQTNGGSYWSLPVSVRSVVPPDKVDTLIDYGKKINAVETNPAVYQRLSDPNVLADLSDDQFYALRMELSETDWQMFAKQRGGNLADTEKLNTAAIDRVLKNRLAELGMDPNPKPGTDDYKRLGVIRSTIDKTILGEQSVAKRQFSESDIEKHIDALWSANTELQNAWYEDMVGMEPERGRLLTLGPGDIPSEDKRAIVASFTNRGLPKPDDYEILRVYIAGQLASQE